MQILSIVFCLAYHTGEIIVLDEPIVIKKHGYRQNSIFRVGLDTLVNILYNISTQLVRWDTVVVLDIPTSRGAKMKNCHVVRYKIESFSLVYSLPAVARAMIKYRSLEDKKMVRSRRLELPIFLQNSTLNAVRLPISPRPLKGFFIAD